MEWRKGMARSFLTSYIYDCCKSGGWNERPGAPAYNHPAPGTTVRWSHHLHSPADKLAALPAFNPNHEFPLVLEHLGLFGPGRRKFAGFGVAPLLAVLPDVHDVVSVGG